MRTLAAEKRLSVGRHIITAVPTVFALPPVFPFSGMEVGERDIHQGFRMSDDEGEVSNDGLVVDSVRLG